MKISYLADCPHEARTIAQWYFDEWAYTVPGVTVEKVLEDIVNNKAHSRENFPLMLTLHESEKLCACADLKLQENKHYPEYRYWIGGVYVEENHRGKGYAAALLKKAKEQVIMLSIEQLYLQSEDKNIALYLKHGFDILHESEHNGIKTIIMVWQNAKC